MENMQISTTQNVSINYEIASVGERLLAGVLDLLMMFVYFLMVSAVNSIFNGGRPLIIVLFVIPFMLYHLVCELVFGGKSLGKLIVGIKVVKIDGTNATLANYLVRWALRLIDVTILVGSIATVTIILNGKGQRLGDIAAKTTVIRLKNKVTLSDTMYQHLPQSYEPFFSEVVNLNDSDISVVNDVLANLRRKRTIPAMQLANKTKFAIESKLGIKSELPSQNFLEVIAKDYIYYNSSQS